MISQTQTLFGIVLKIRMKVLLIPSIAGANCQKGEIMVLDGSCFNGPRCPFCYEFFKAIFDLKPKGHEQD